MKIRIEEISFYDGLSYLDTNVDLEGTLHIKGDDIMSENGFMMNESEFDEFYAQIKTMFKQNEKEEK